MSVGNTHAGAGFTALAALGCALLVSGAAHAASWQHRYGADLHGGAPMLRAAADGGYLTLDTEQLAAGTGQQNIAKGRPLRPEPDLTSPNGGFYCYPNRPLRARVMKVDAAGALLWAYEYQVGGGCTAGRDLASTGDGGAVFVAATPPPADGSLEVPAVVRLDRFGKIVWQVAFSSSRPVYLDAIAVRADGTILVAGAAYGSDKNVIALDDGGRIVSVDSLQGDFDSIEGLVAFNDGYAAALGWVTYPQYEVMLDRVPAVVRVRGGSVLWSVKLPTVPALVNYVVDIPVALLPAPGQGVVVQSTTGRDAMLDGQGSVRWSHYVGNHVSRARLLFGTVDAAGTFWRPFGAPADPSVDSAWALHRVALNGAVSDVVLGSSAAAPLALASSSSGILGVLAADNDGDLNDATAVLAYDAAAPGCLATAAAVDAQPFTDLGTAAEPAAVAIGPGSVTTTPINAIRYCLSVSDALLCGANAVRAAQGEACGGPLLTFELSDEQKVLIRNDGPAAYLSRYQSLLAGDPSIQSPDRHVEVRVRATRDGIPAAGVNVYFRVTDPPDTAPYTIAAHDARADDNDPAGPKGALIVPLPCANAPSGAAPCTPSGADGWARVILTITDHAAGDNYVVEASTDPAFPCAGGCAHSGLITAWKRVYIEADTMFRKGAYVGRTVAAGESEVVINLPRQATGPGIQPFREGQHVLFIHGEPYLHGPSSAGQKLTPSAYAEEADIARTTKADPRPGVGRNAKGEWVLRLAKPLSNGFSRSEYSNVYPFLADAVGVITGSAPGMPADYYVADQSLLAGHLATMQVDVRAAPQAFSAFPFASEFTVREEGLMSLRWFANASRGDTVNDVRSLPNHIHLVGASVAKIEPTCSTQFGDTLVQLGNNRSFVYVGRIEQASVDPNFLGSGCGPAPTYRKSVQMAIQGTVTHEVTHQWRVNHRPGGDVDANGEYTGHCTERLPTGDMCLMHRLYPDTGSPSQVDAGRTAMHYLAHGTNSEYFDVRRVQDPMPQQVH
jgi:hypothetical protein